MFSRVIRPIRHKCAACRDQRSFLCRRRVITAPHVQAALLYANTHWERVMLQEEIAAIVRVGGGRLQAVHALSDAAGSTALAGVADGIVSVSPGRISKALMQRSVHVVRAEAHCASFPVLAHWVLNPDICSHSRTSLY